MTRASYDDDDEQGQVDGDEPIAADFASRYQSVGQPWLRSGVPPWHMWGNTQVLGPILPETEVSVPPLTAGQLVKVSYKRPESWHWVFAARILEAPIPGPSASGEIEVFFDVIIGVGRAQLTMPGFDRFRWVWTGLELAPTSHVMWSTSALTPALDYTAGPTPEPDLTARRLITQIVSQDIQVNCRARFANSSGDGTATVEVSAFLSPKTHNRPDWLIQRSPPEVMFAGDEIGGR
jgi:hypothetical protein